MAARTPRSPATPEPVQPSVPKAKSPAAATVPVVAKATAAPVTPAATVAAATPAVPVATVGVPAPQTPSVLERLRRNRMGAVLGGLIVALAVALLLSVLVPDTNLLLALGILGLAEAFAVGFTVRYLSGCRGLRHQITAFVLATAGVHVLATTGIVNQKLGDVSALLSGGFGGSGGGSGLGWDDALVGAFATPAVSTGAVLCGLVAAIIAGWGVRDTEYTHS